MSLPFEDRMAGSIARELNRLRQEDCDFFGPDSAALLELLDEYLPDTDGWVEQNTEEEEVAQEAIAYTAPGIIKTITIIITLN